MSQAAEPTELVLVAAEDGLIVSGPSQEVERLVADLVRIGGAEVTSSGLAPVTDVVAAVASVAVSSCEYVRHTARSLALLRENGLVPAGEGGAFRSFVFSNGKFAGNLDWSPVSLGPERALAIQSAALGLALRTAIKPRAFGGPNGPTAAGGAWGAA
ncbi:MAG: hypothetical protein ABIX10_07650 [Acidimicrobiales bacterium]